MSSSRQPTQFYPDQLVPLSLTLVIFAILSGLVYLTVVILNRFVISRETISLTIHWSDVAIGMTIYLKTAIDFAIFIGRLMHHYPGWKNRIMIEIGTALGNALGTIGILIIWDFFREVRFLMAAMITLAALVLFRLAEDGLEHVKDSQGKYHSSFAGFAIRFENILHQINRAVAPILNRLIPQLSVSTKEGKSYQALFTLSLTVPFILGLDDFAGYIPLFNVINVLGFSIGVLLGHMLLNIFLFLSPRRTIQAVKNPIISFIGSLAFVGLGIWGLVEVAHLIGF